MPLLVGCLALCAPRFVLFLVWLLSDYLGAAYATWIWPLLGFFFLPLTTLAYAWAWHNGAGSVSGVGLAVVVVAVLIDLSMLGGGGEASRRHHRHDD